MAFYPNSLGRLADRMRATIGRLLAAPPDPLTTRVNSTKVRANASTISPPLIALQQRIAFLESKHG